MRIIFIQWVSWHFDEMPKEIVKAWKNFLKFNLNYFSVNLLLKTFFSPWKRYSFSCGRGLDIGKYMESLISNLIFRGLGALLRSGVIAVGLAAELFLLFFGFIIVVLWFFLPLILILGLVFGFKIML